MKNLNELEVSDYLFDSVNVNAFSLNDEFVRVSADLAYWGAKFTEAHKTFLKSKLNLDVGEARLLIEVRERLTIEGKKPTESVVDAGVKSCIDYQALRIKHIDAEVERDRIRLILDAVRAKKDMLVSIGATVRAEMSGDPYLRKSMSDARTSTTE